MKILILTTLAFGFLLFNATSCHKDDMLPPETQEGKNTFCCKVNEIVLLNKGQPYFDRPNLGSVIYSLISDGQLIDTKRMVLTD